MTAPAISPGVRRRARTARLAVAPRSALLGALTFAVLGSAPARAQESLLAATPLAVEPARMAVGSWADYALTSGDRTRRLRWTLVGRTPAGGLVLEVAIFGAGAPELPALALRLSLTPGRGSGPARLTGLLVQAGAAPPMIYPVDLPQLARARFARPPRRALARARPIEVPAGMRSACLLRTERDGERVEAWIDQTVPPLGLVRLEVTPLPSGPAGRRRRRDEPRAGRSPPPRFTLELLGSGHDGRPTIVDPPVPFDPTAFGLAQEAGQGAPAPAGVADVGER